MSLRTGKGSLSLSKPSKAKLRQIGERGRQTQRDNKAYSERIPF